MLYTSLKLLRQNFACSAGMSTLIASLPASQTEDKLIPLSHILKSNGLQHAIWALRATAIDSRRIAASMAIDFAMEALPLFEQVYSDDKRPRIALETAKSFLEGKATLQEVEASEAASRAASAASAASEAASWTASQAATAATAASAAARWTASAARWTASAASAAARWTASAVSEAASAASEAASRAKQNAIFTKWDLIESRAADLFGTR